MLRLARRRKANGAHGAKDRPGPEVADTDGSVVATHPAPPAMPKRLNRMAAVKANGGWVLIRAAGIGRVLGLMRLDPPPANVALHLPRCSSVHTMNVRFPIDVVFFDRAGKVLRVVRDVPRGRMCAQRGAVHVIETRAGFADRLLAAGLPASTWAGRTRRGRNAA